MPNQHHNSTNILINWDGTTRDQLAEHGKIARYDLANEFVDGVLRDIGRMSILTYHDPAHTLNFFLPVALALADLYGIKESDPVLYQAIELAAKSHDIGFMYQYENNEPIAAHVLEESLPRFEFKRPLIGLNSRLILVTSSSLSEDPKDLLEMLMCDSDLGILGHSDFPDRNAALRQELANYGQEFTDEQWYTSQLGFLRNHRYFTTAAQSMFDEQKEKNVEYMQSKLDELNRMWSK